MKHLFYSLLTLFLFCSIDTKGQNSPALLNSLLKALIPGETDAAPRPWKKAKDATPAKWDNAAPSGMEDISTSGNMKVKLQHSTDQLNAWISLIGRDQKGYNIFNVTVSDMPGQYSFETLAEDVLTGIPATLLNTKKDETSMPASNFYCKGYEISLPGKKTVWAYIFTVKDKKTIPGKKQQFSIFCFTEESKFLIRSSITDWFSFMNTLDHMNGQFYAEQEKLLEEKAPVTVNAGSAELLHGAALLFGSVKTRLAIKEKNEVFLQSGIYYSAEKKKLFSSKSMKKDNFLAAAFPTDMNKDHVEEVFVSTSTTTGQTYKLQVLAFMKKAGQYSNAGTMNFTSYPSVFKSTNQGYNDIGQYPSPVYRYNGTVYALSLSQPGEMLVNLDEFSLDYTAPVQLIKDKKTICNYIFSDKKTKLPSQRRSFLPVIFYCSTGTEGIPC